MTERASKQRRKSKTKRKKKYGKRKQVRYIREKIENEVKEGAEI